MAVCGDTNIPPIKNAIMIFLHLNSNLVIKYAVIAVALLNLVYAWNEFTFSINFVSDEYFYTIPIGIMSFSQALYTNWVVLLAGIVLSIIPVLIVFIAFQKYFVTGLTAGSVKE